MTLMLKKTTLYYLGLVVTLLIIANCGGSGYKNITGPEPITVDGVTFERIRVGWNENIDECVVMAFFTRQSDESDDFPPT